MLSILEFPEMAKIFNCYFMNMLAEGAILGSSLLIKQHFFTGKSVLSISWKTAYTFQKRTLMFQVANIILSHYAKLNKINLEKC
jgi:hypothetical protein